MNTSHVYNETNNIKQKDGNIWSLKQYTASNQSRKGNIVIGRGS